MHVVPELHYSSRMAAMGAFLLLNVCIPQTAEKNNRKLLHVVASPPGDSKSLSDQLRRVCSVFQRMLIDWQRPSS